jgi:hypothetical protein
MLRAKRPRWRPPGSLPARRGHAANQDELPGHMLFDDPCGEAANGRQQAVSGIRRRRRNLLRACRAGAVHGQVRRLSGKADPGPQLLRGIRQGGAVGWPDNLRRDSSRESQAQLTGWYVLSNAGFNYNSQN